MPVVSTAFRPLDADELARNPFRVFTSMLVVDDPRYFDADTRAGCRRSWPSGCCSHPSCSRSPTGPPPRAACRRDAADELLRRATAAFALSSIPVDRAWYDQLEHISAVAADIGGVPTTHLNHLTPRVLDIDELQARMRARGIEMIDEIQGPPRGTARTCCYGRRRSARSPRSGCSGTPTGRCAPARCGCGSGRSSSAGSR